MNQTQKKIEHLVNHVVFCIDESGSMDGKQSDVDCYTKERCFARSNKNATL